MYKSTVVAHMDAGTLKFNISSHKLIGITNYQIKCNIIQYIY